MNFARENLEDRECLAERPRVEFADGTVWDADEFSLYSDEIVLLASVSDSLIPFVCGQIYLSSRRVIPTRE